MFQAIHTVLNEKDVDLEVKDPPLWSVDWFKKSAHLPVQNHQKISRFWKSLHL